MTLSSPTHLLSTLFACAALAAGCGDKDGGDSGHDHDHDHGTHVDTAALDYAASMLTEGGTWYLSYTSDPAPIPFNQNFTLDVEVWDAAQSALQSEVDLELLVEMPNHDHGMNTEPVVIPNGDGTFEVEGMLFHMTGYWSMVFTVDGSEAAEFNVWCCE